MDWKEMDVEELVKDTTSSSGDTFYGAIDMATVYEQAMTTRQMKKQFRNAHYGKSAMRSREEQQFRKAAKEIDNSPNGKRINAREIRGFRTVLLDSIKHIAEQGRRPQEGYKWFLHMETMEMVRFLFDDHFVRMNQTTGINPDTYEMEGVEFVMSKGVPEGQIILADEEFIKRDPIRPHPMVLIENATDGYPTEIDLNVGGEMELYTIQK